jgi:L-iditol 2-dehydrogenase
MATKRKAVVFYGVDNFKIEELDIPKIGPDDVLVRIKSVGVCGSDVHFYKEGRIGPYVPKPGHIIGHECAGEIVEVGKNVKDRKPGDRVAIEPGTPCGHCDLCKIGKYNLCREMSFMGHPDPVREGALVEYSVTSAAFTYPLADSMSFDEGAMLEPLAVAMQALKRGRVKAGHTLAILGSGPIGLSMLLAAKAFGCAETYMTDRIQYRLDYAKKFGATKTFNADKDDYVKEIMEATHGRGVDVVIEAAGNPEAYKRSTSIATRGGMVVFVGMAAEEMFPINVFEITDRELDIASVFRYANVYDQAIRLAGAGLIDMKKLITHRMPMEKAGEAMNMAYEKRDNVIKIVINF